MRSKLRGVHIHEMAESSALAQVFGRWMVCKDSNVASKVIAATRNINCVTSDGDVHEKRGTLTGGYRSDRRSVVLHTSSRAMDKINLCDIVNCSQ